MKGFGLVFSGGGAKGAYEIGVWKYLHEFGFDRYVRAISGTSVGALNAALFLGSSFENAEKMWQKIGVRDVLTPKTSLLGDYLFSREGIIEMIDDGVNFDLIQKSNIPCIVTCYKSATFEIERFRLNAYPRKDAISILLASSAIPKVFPKESFGDKQYVDGGLPFVGDNTPILPIYERGAKTIIVVHLKQGGYTDKELYKHSEIIDISPSEDLGGLITGTLNFNQDKISELIKLGYLDARNALHGIREKLYTVEYYDKADLISEFEYYHNLAENGNAEAQYVLANMYLYGYGTEKNTSEAFEWYYKSGKNGFVSAYFQLGVLFENHELEGCGVDYIKFPEYAFSCYGLAAESGHSEAQYKFGLLTGDKEWLRKAAENGCKKAQRMLW